MIGRVALLIALGAAPGVARAGEAPAAAPAAPAIDIEGFLKHHAAGTPSVMEHPQVRCLLESFVPQERRDALDQLNMWLHSGARGDDGAYLLEGFFPGGACQRAVLWIHPDGRVFGGDDPCEGRLRAWTNDEGLKEHPPAAVIEWMTTGHWGFPADAIDWAAPVPARRVPASCTRSALVARIEEAERRLDGMLCDASVPFVRGIAVVRPHVGATAPIARRGPPSASPPRRPYLVADDVVDLAFSSGGYTCARWSRPGRTVAGWMSDADLDVIEDRMDSGRPWDADAAMRLRKLVSDTPPPCDITGEWDQLEGGADMSIRRDAAGRLHLDANVGIGESEPNLSVDLESSGRAAWHVPQDPESDCGFVILRFNNALAVFENGNCGDRYGYLDGLFTAGCRPAPK